MPAANLLLSFPLQNDAIRNKKISNNPFARAFRDTGARRNRARANGQHPTTVLQGARDAVEALQEALDSSRLGDRRHDCDSPMSSAGSTSSATSSTSVFPGLPTPPDSRSPSPPLRMSMQPTASTPGFTVDDILSDRYPSKRPSSVAPATPAVAAPLPVLTPLYRFVYPWMPYGHGAHAAFYAHTMAPLPASMAAAAAEAYRSYPAVFGQEYP